MVDQHRLRIGFGKVDITPPLSIPYLSYHPRQTPFQGIHDHLFARALAAQGPTAVSGRQQALAIVTADSLGFSRSVLGSTRDFIGEVRSRIAANLGIPGSNVLIAASHAHSTPQTTDIASLLEDCPAAADWLEQLIDQLVAAVALAWANREPASVRGAIGMAPGIGHVRHLTTIDSSRAQAPDSNPAQDPSDDCVPVLLVEGERHRGAVLGFTCHPDTVQVQPLVSADYPGVACRLLERELGLDACLFLQGACGNVDPVRHTTNFDDVALYGRSLGGEALRTLSLLQAPDIPAMPAVLGAKTEIVQLERRPLPAIQPLLAEVETRRTRIDPADPGTLDAAIAAYREVAEPLRLVGLGSGPVPVEVQALRLGDAAIVACEGELFLQYGLRIKAASPAAITFIAGYSNGYQGYFPTPESYDNGSYEGTLGPWSRVWRTGAEMITQHAVRLVEALWQNTEE